MKTIRYLCLAVLGAASLSSTSQASELSLLSGVLRTENREVASQDKGRKTEIEFGGRYSDVLDKNIHWFGQGNLALRTFSKGADGLAPDNSTSLSAGGGLRYYFGKLSENIATFAYGLGEFKVDKNGIIDASGQSVTTEKNGLYYGGTFGIRLYLGSDFFCDLETPIFDSALFATEMTRTETKAAGSDEVRSVEDKTTRTDLYVDTTGAFSSIKVAMGLRF